jgi:putative sigma-54 modulation protein
VKTTIKARNLELSDKLRADIERKMRRLDRVTHADATAMVELTGNASRANDGSHVADVAVQMPSGDVLRSTASGPNPVAALDRLLDKLERQLVRSKERQRDSRLRDVSETEAILAREGLGTLEPATGTAVSTEETGSGPEIVKIKRFDMKPMFDEDAIARMEELGHQFFVFLNAETDSINVVYRRAAGDYGVIEPIVRR